MHTWKVCALPLHTLYMRETVLLFLGDDSPPKLCQGKASCPTPSGRPICSVVIYPRFPTVYIWYISCFPGFNSQLWQQESRKDLPWSLLTLRYNGIEKLPQLLGSQPEGCRFHFQRQPADLVSIWLGAKPHQLLSLPLSDGSSASWKWGHPAKPQSCGWPPSLYQSVRHGLSLGNSLN